MSAEHPYDWKPPADRSILDSYVVDEAWESTLRPLMDAIEHSVVRMTRARDYFTIDGTTAYDGVEVAIEWNRPTAIRPLEFSASLETIELMVNIGLIPLCERQIPAEGTE